LETASPKDRLYHDDRTLKNVNDMDEDTCATVASIETEEKTIDGVDVGRTTKVRFCDKIAALDKAMRHLGLYERDNA
jgi:hypothetical protein